MAWNVRAGLGRVQSAATSSRLLTPAGNHEPPKSQQNRSPGTRSHDRRPRAKKMGAMVLSTIEPETSGTPWLFMEEGSRVGLAVTDHDWVIEHVSRDGETILGLSPGTYEGSSLLGLFQPADVPNFVSAVRRVAGDGGAATVRARLRTGNGHWREVRCLVVAMCRHSPPRLGLAVTTIPEAAADLVADRHRHIAGRGVDVLGGMDRVRLGVPCGISLSSRQWEILTKLVRGHRVQGIADALYLSPSTVRNHLAAIFSKFGVHSQAELLARLLAPGDGPEASESARADQESSRSATTASRSIGTRSDR
jgi:DNA-binding NarL/FixJ family response regulator